MSCQILFELEYKKSNNLTTQNNFYLYNSKAL